MTASDLPDAAARPRRKLPKQLSNETKMIDAAIALLADRPVSDVTSRRIAEASGTTVSHLSRYWGGRDEFFVEVTRELGRRITTLIRAAEPQLDLDDIGGSFQRLLTLDEVATWFKLYRYLAGREQLAGLETGEAPAPLTAVRDGLAFVFSIDADESQVWATLLLTYFLGSQVFGRLLGTGPDEFAGVMDLLGDAIKLRAAAVAAERPDGPDVPEDRRDRPAGRRGTDRFLAP